MYKKWKDSQKTQSVVEEAEEEDDSENLQVNEDFVYPLSGLEHTDVRRSV